MSIESERDDYRYIAEELAALVRVDIQNNDRKLELVNQLLELNRGNRAKPATITKHCHCGGALKVDYKKVRLSYPKPKEYQTTCVSCDKFIWLTQEEANRVKINNRRY